MILSPCSCSLVLVLLSYRCFHIFCLVTDRLSESTLKNSNIKHVQRAVLEVPCPDQSSLNTELLCLILGCFLSWGRCYHCNQANNVCSGLLSEHQTNKTGTDSTDVYYTGWLHGMFHLRAMWKLHLIPEASRRQYVAQQRHISFQV